MKKNKNVIKLILKIIKEHPVFVLCTILSSVFSSGIAYYPAVMINKKLINIVTSEIQSNIISIVIAVIFLTLSFEFWEVLINKIQFLFIISLRRQKEKVINTYNAELVSKITSVKGDYLESSETYELYIKCKNQSLPKIIDTPHQVMKIISNIFSFIIYVNILRKVSFLFFIAVITVAVIRNCLLLKRKRRQYKYDDVINSFSIKLDSFSEMITDKKFMAEIKVYDSLEYINHKRKCLYNKMRSEVWKMTYYDLAYSFTSFIFENCAYYGSYVFLALKRLNNFITMGEFTSTVASVKQLEMSVLNIFSAAGNMMGNSRYYDDYFRFVDSMPLQRNGEDIPCAESIKIENLGYAYLSNPFSTLNNLSCKLAPGTKVCIVGKNGSGKSTLAKVISGIYEMYSGNIYINNIDAKYYSVSSMMHQIDVCPQNFTKYPFSLKYNVDFDNQDDNKLNHALLRSGVCDFLANLPDSINTNLDSKYDVRGVDLSDGQWQRILLARVFFENKNIIIFDEPTSSLDPVMENQIFNELLKIQDRLVIIISHRMSCARLMDQIIVLNEGQIAEIGTHSELMDHKDLYFKMFTSQADKYDVNE